MEFSILKHFKGFEDIPKNPLNPNEMGTSLFLTGNMGPRISKKMDGYAKRAGLSRRRFIGSSLGFSAAMLATSSTRPGTVSKIRRPSVARSARAVCVRCWPRRA